MGFTSLGEVPVITVEGSRPTESLPFHFELTPGAKH